MVGRTYRSRAPLRLGLAGGGTDVSPFSDQFGGLTLNATIDLYAQAILEPTDDGKFTICTADLGEVARLSTTDEFHNDPMLRLHQGVHRRIVQQFNGGRPLSLRLTTYADVPVGSGLGTSSSMVVCMLRAYAEWLQLSLSENAIARMAFEIERKDLSMPGGKQDSYAAAHGGFNFFEFGPEEHVLVQKLRLKDWVIDELEASTVLYYTGVSRESAHIIQRQIDNAQAGLRGSLDAMQAIKQAACNMKHALLQGNLNQYAELLELSWRAKKRMVDGISNPEIDALYNHAVSAGALCGKISGAGGGGCMMLFVPPAHRMNVLQALSQCNGRVMNFHFTSLGAQSWTLPP